VNEALMNATKDAQRLAIQRGRLYQIRMRVRDQFLPRARARLALLLPLSKTDQKLIDDARKAEEVAGG